MWITIIGFGRVGMPLGLCLESKGANVSALDTDDKLIQSFRNKIMPFNEPGCDELLKKSEIRLFDKRYSPIPDSDAYIITVGTPYRSHIEINFNYLKNVLAELIKIDLEGKIIILRSTVAPGTTQQVMNFIESNTWMINGKDFYLAMCPERIAEGFALNELVTLPQIIGVEDTPSFDKVSEVFKYLGVELLQCSFIEAELSKLLTNIYRYIDFAIPNYFMCISNFYGTDGLKLFELMNYKYPRNLGLKKPGLVAGTCLRKDFSMINESFPQTDIILQAYKINEYMPKFYTDLLGKKLREKKIGILGYTFKADVDDIRDSLVPKLIRYIERYIPEKVMVNDPYLPKQVNDIYDSYDFENQTVETIIENCEIIFVAINHTLYKNLKFRKGQTIVDIWNLFNRGLIWMEE